MYIDEIPNNAHIVIRFEADNKFAEIDTITKVASTTIKINRYKAAHVYHRDGKVVNPNSFKGSVTVSYMPNNASRPEIWYHVRIIYSKNTHEYYLETQASSKTIERRKHSRVPVGCPAQVQFEDRSARWDGSVHDISATGIGITMPQIPQHIVGKRVFVTFKDAKEFKSFNLHATCVRVVKSSKNLYLYGFKFGKVTPDLIEYVKLKFEAYESQKKGK